MYPIAPYLFRFPELPVIALFATAFLSVANCYAGSNNQSAASSSNPDRPENAVSDLASRTVKLEDIAIHPERSASATALSLNSSILSAQIQATVKQINAGVSTEIKKNDPLIVLDCSDYQFQHGLAVARKKTAQAYLTLASNELKRAQSLTNKSLTSEQTLDNARADFEAKSAALEVANIEIESAKLNVDRCVISAPFDGVVTERIASEGQLATIGTPLIKLVENSKLELSAKVDPSDLPLIIQATKLYFDFGEKIIVHLDRAAAVVDPTARSQEIRLVFPEEQPLAGTAGKLTWKDPRFFVPSSLIKPHNGERGIFITRSAPDNEQPVVEFFPLRDVIPGRPHPVDLPPGTGVVVYENYDSTIEPSH